MNSYETANLLVFLSRVRCLLLLGAYTGLGALFGLSVAIDSQEAKWEKKRETFSLGEFVAQGSMAARVEPWDFSELIDEN